MIVGTCSSFVYAVVIAEEKTSHAVKAITSVILVMGVPWAIKTDNSLAYTSQQFNEFVASWKTDLTFGIISSPHGQAIVKRSNRPLKELLAWVNFQNPNMTHMALECPDHRPPKQVIRAWSTEIHEVSNIKDTL